MTDKNSDKRRFYRVFYQSNAILSNESFSLSCKLVDISLKGCLLCFDSPWNGSLESLYTLKLSLSEDIVITMQVTPAHIVGNNAGFKCEHIDIASISELRRLVELNLGDSDMLERDLLALSEFSA